MCHVRLSRCRPGPWTRLSQDRAQEAASIIYHATYTRLRYSGGEMARTLILEPKLPRAPRLIRDGAPEGGGVTSEMSDHDCSLSVSRKEVSDGRGAG